MDNSLLRKDIVIHEQGIKAMNYLTQFGEEIDFFDPEKLDFGIEYEIYSNSENERDHIVTIELKFSSKSENEEELENSLVIFAEGWYEVVKEVPKKDIYFTKHYGSVGNLLTFMRSAIFSFTSMTGTGGYMMPLISLKDLNKKYQDKKKSKLKKKAPNKKS